MIGAARFDPGDGWRPGPVPLGDPDGRYEVLQLTTIRLGGEHLRERRTWHRPVEELVPPLPTEPYTVIRATWPQRVGVLTLIDDLWHGDDGEVSTSSSIHQNIDGFQVLAQPAGEQSDRDDKEDTIYYHAVRAVLKRLEQIGTSYVYSTIVPQLRDEFGVKP